MITLIERRHIVAPPQRVWEFFEAMESNYPRWHPEHLQWRWLKGQPLTTGAIWYADEWVGPMRISGRFFVPHAEKTRSMSFRFGFPHSLVRARGTFRFEPAPDGGSYIEEEMQFGFRTPVIAQLTDILMRATLPIAEFRRHVREEQTNLGRLLADTTG